MALPSHIACREQAKFKECNGEVAVNTTICQEPGDALDVSIQGFGATPAIINQSTGAIAAEISIVIPTNTTRFLLRSRISARVRVAFATGETTTKFLEIKPGTSWVEEGLLLTGPVTIFVASNKLNTPIELLYWI